MSNPTTGPLLVIGRTGQVARELGLQAAAQGIALNSLGREALDLTELSGLAAQARLAATLRDGGYRAVINAAAYTAVDKAEEEPDLAMAVNGKAPGVLATLCAAVHVPLIHISTDYVFDGTKTGAYREDDPIAPLGAYGRCKAAGEAAVREAADRHLILRTAWVYSTHGHNFVKTMLRIGAQRDDLRVVADQHGAPTSAADIAAACLTIAAQMAQRGDTFPYGTYHYTGGGQTSWHGFAEAIFDLAAPEWGRRPSVAAITTAEYPTPAARPLNSVLDTAKISGALGIQPVLWRDALKPVVTGLLAQSNPVSP